MTHPTHPPLGGGLQEKPLVVAIVPPGSRRAGMELLLKAVGDAARVLVAEPGAVPDEAGDMEILITWNGGSPRLLLEEIGGIPPRLRWIHHSGIGVDQFLSTELVASEVVITNLAGLNIYAPAMAEFVIALMLFLVKDFREIEQDRMKHAWMRHPQVPVAGLTMGLVGFGGVGQAVARLALALGMGVVATRRSAEHQRTDRVVILPAQDLPVLLQESHVVVVAAPLTSETRGLIDRQALARMRPDSILINVARAGLVVERALVDALLSRHLKAAALDVFADEPLPPSSRLWDIDNLFLSPHVSGYIRGSEAAKAQAVAANLERFLRGEDLACLVDKRRGY